MNLGVFKIPLFVGFPSPTEQQSPRTPQNAQGAKQEKRLRAASAPGRPYLTEHGPRENERRPQRLPQAHGLAQKQDREKHGGKESCF